MEEKDVRYNPKLKEKARELRNNSTLGEVLLWSKVLRAKQLNGNQFNRQHALLIATSDSEYRNIIVDFICRKHKLIIEIDGYSHNFKYEDDILRDNLLIQNGYTILRFTEKDVRYDIENVKRSIEIKIDDIERNPPNPLLKKGE